MPNLDGKYPLNFSNFVLKGRRQGVKTVYGDNLMLHVFHVISVLDTLSLFIRADVYWVLSVNTLKNLNAFPPLIPLNHCMIEVLHLYYPHALNHYFATPFTLWLVCRFLNDLFGSLKTQCNYLSCKFLKKSLYSKWYVIVETWCIRII